MTDVPLRVMLVLTRFNIGGVSHQAILLAEGLQALGCEVTLVAGQESPGEGNMADISDVSHLRMLRIPTLRREISPLTDIRALLALWKLIRRERPHVVQTNMAKAGQLGRLAARLNRVSVVLHVFHGHIFHSYFGGLSTRVFAAFERLMSRLGDGLVTLTDGLRRELVDFRIAPAPRIHVIPSLMNFAGFRSAEGQRGDFRAEFGLSPDAPLIGLVGRLVDVKNPTLFLTAAQEVLTTHPNTHFVLVGDGDLRPALETFAREKNIADAVTFTGWRGDLTRIYRDLDAAVICSRNEGSPISILEPVALDVPVVATRVGGIPDLLSDETASLIASDDSAALADALRRILDNPATALTLAHAARTELEERFDVARNTVRYLALYEQIRHSKDKHSPRFDAPQ